MPWKDPEIRRQKKREWYKRTKETRLEYHRQYRADNIHAIVSKSRLTHVKRQYNLEANDYLNMVIEQQNRCAICGGQETTSNKHGDVRPLAVDHCHATGKVRALLCARCNGMLGCCSDNIDILEKAIEYLSKHKE